MCTEQKHYEIQKMFILVQYEFSNKSMILTVKIPIIPLTKNGIGLSKFEDN